MEHSTIYELLQRYQALLVRQKAASNRNLKEDLDSIDNYQNNHRQASVLYTALAHADKIQHLVKYFISGNLLSDTNFKKQNFTQAFNNSSFSNQITYYIMFLRENMHYTASLFYHSIREHKINIRFVAFSTIPTLFQQGWCMEEDLLWSSFLGKYMKLISSETKTRLNSSVFEPITAFLLQSLANDFLQLSVLPDLRVLAHDNTVAHDRIKFTFNGLNLVPKEYIQKLYQTATLILEKMVNNLSHIPLSVRNLFSNATKLHFQIEAEKISGINCAVFIFLNCCLIPALKEPHLIGLNTDGCEQFILDDLANLFFFSNFQTIKMAPPVILTFLSMLDSSVLQVTNMVSNLVASSRHESSIEIHEKLLLELGEIPKRALFMPYDLYFIHMAFKNSHKFAKKALSRHGKESLKSFDFLFNIDLELKKPQAYNMFYVMMKQAEMVERDPSVNFSQLNASSQKSFNYIFSELQPVLFLNKDDQIRSVLEFALVLAYKNLDTKLVAALLCVLDKMDNNPNIMREFLEFLVQKKEKVLELSNKKDINIQMELNEIKHMNKRNEDISQKLTMTSYRMLIWILIQKIAFNNLSYFDEHIDDFINDNNEFEKFIVKISKKFNSFIDSRFTAEKFNKDRKEQCVAFFEKILYIFLVDRIPYERFVQLHEFKFKFLLSNNVNTIIQEIEPILTGNRKKYTDKAIRLLNKAHNSNTVSKIVYLINRMINVVLTLVDDQSEEKVLAITGFIITKTSIEKSIQLYEFISHFYPTNEKLIDPIGSEDISKWEIFASAFQKS